MSTIPAEEAFRLLAKWSRRDAAIHVSMSRSVGQRTASMVSLNQVLPHSQKALLTLRDENGDDVGVTVDLTGAEWETGTGRLAATFPNGNRYVFGERAEVGAE